MKSSRKGSNSRTKRRGTGTSNGEVGLPEGDVARSRIALARVIPTPNSLRELEPFRPNLKEGLQFPYKKGAEQAPAMARSRFRICTGTARESPERGGDDHDVSYGNWSQPMKSSRKGSNSRTKRGYLRWRSRPLRGRYSARRR